MPSFHLLFPQARNRYLIAHAYFYPVGPNPRPFVLFPAIGSVMCHNALSFQSEAPLLGREVGPGRRGVVTGSGRCKFLRERREGWRGFLGPLWVLTPRESLVQILLSLPAGLVLPAAARGQGYPAECLLIRLSEAQKMARQS
ncbi:unnamed protein product [Lepidochelys olivacea]